MSSQVDGDVRGDRDDPPSRVNPDGEAADAGAASATERTLHRSGEPSGPRGEDDCRHAYICQKCGGGYFDDPDDAVKWLSDGEDDIVEEVAEVIKEVYNRAFRHALAFAGRGEQFNIESQSYRRQAEDLAARLRRSAPREVVGEDEIRVRILTGRASPPNGSIIITNLDGRWSGEVVGPPIGDEP